MVLLSFLIVLIYACIVAFYALQFLRFNSINLNENQPSTRFSIVIPFRNEAENIPQLISSLSLLKYPKDLYDIFLINDGSTDDSMSICKKLIKNYKLYNAQILENENLVDSYKKSAILTALNRIKDGYFITTDADCVLPEKWLISFDEHIKNSQSLLIAAPVKIVEDSKFWTRFQMLDLMSLQVLGLGSFQTRLPLLCNAANLCCEVKTFNDIEAYKTHNHIASGDDVFTLQAFLEAGKKCSALVQKEALVLTKPVLNFKALTQQRVRWASKTKFYKNHWLIIIGVIVFLTNLCLVLSLLSVLITGYNDWIIWLWVLKLIADVLVLFIANLFFKTGLKPIHYLINLILYPFVSSFFAIKSLQGNFEWKERNYEL